MPECAPLDGDTPLLQEHQDRNDGEGPGGTITEYRQRDFPLGGDIHYTKTNRSKFAAHIQHIQISLFSAVIILTRISENTP